ncbi:hypothetical protein EON64_13380, partial [archaeon]
MLIEVFVVVISVAVLFFFNQQQITNSLVSLFRPPWKFHTRQAHMSQGTAKHETGTTLGKHPELYPYVLKHIDEQASQKTLRDQIVQQERSGMMGAPDEAQFLAWFAATTNAKKIIEIGVFRGSTTLALALATSADTRIVGLD